jgi:hypothetical protein
MKTFMKDQPHWSLAAVAVLVVALYWSLVATDRYVSESHIVLQSPEVNPAAFNVSSLLSGTSGSGDLLLLKDHLQSVDILQKLEQRLALRQHYSSTDIDWFARLSAADLPQEKFVKYMQSRISIEFDDYAAVLRVKVQAYDAQKARQIAQALLEEGELHMNQMGQRLAAEQVAFIETQELRLPHWNSACLPPVRLCWTIRISMVWCRQPVLYRVLPLLSVNWKVSVLCSKPGSVAWQNFRVKIPRTCCGFMRNCKR